jgi:hypothetical protein
MARGGPKVREDSPEEVGSASASFVAQVLAGQISSEDPCREGGWLTERKALVLLDHA